MQRHRQRRATRRSPATPISPKGGGGTTSISLPLLLGDPQRHRLVVVAIKQANGEMTFNPAASTRLLTNDILVVIGKNPDLQRLEKDCKGP